MIKKLFIFLLIISLIGVVSAKTTELIPSVSDFQLESGDTKTFTIAYTISDIEGNGSSLVSIGGYPKYISYSGEKIDYFKGETSTGTINLAINIPSNAKSGVVVNTISLAEGNVDIYLDIKEIESGCRLIELPHPTSFEIIQGEVIQSDSIRVKVSSECPILSMDVSQLKQMSKPMYLQGTSGDFGPGDEFTFSIKLDAVDVSNGPYENTYIVSGNEGNNLYEKRIDLKLQVKTGTSPITNNTFDNMPTCTVPHEINMNNTYKLVCTNENPLIDIEIPYNEFFEGIRVSGNKNFEYSFKANRIGNTDFMALFKYKGVVVRNPFIQEIRISTSGNSPVSGTSLKFIFYQNGVKKDPLVGLNPAETTIMIIDNKTDSIVQDFFLFLNGITINNTYTFQENQAYELRVSSPGYLDLTTNINVSKNIIDIIINPLREFYNRGDEINITSSLKNVTFTIDDVLVEGLYIIDKTGEIIIKAQKEGYTPSNKNISVQERITLLSCAPIREDWSVGDKVICDIDKNVSWQITIGDELIESGEGTRLEFKITKEGHLRIESGDIYINGFVVEKGSSWYNPLSWGWVKGLGWWWVVVILIIGTGIYFLFFRGDGDEDGIPMLGGN